MPGELGIRGTTRLAGVIGWPVEHSRSPQMHNAAYAALGMDWAYVPLAVPPDRLTEAIRGLAALGFAGANVTIPHKQGVAQAMDELSQAARDAASVNTVVVRDDGSLLGETTDGDGLLDAIGDLPAGRAVVLGAGGSARSVVAALRAVGADVAVSARPPQAAAELGVEVTDWPLREPAGLIVNATPVAQRGDAAELPLDPAALDGTAVVCDLVYRADGGRTGLLAEADRRGVRTVDGLAVLVGQGVRSFRLFTGVGPPVGVMDAGAPGGPCGP
jgi:shikimate dehydrogenase